MHKETERQQKISLKLATECGVERIIYLGGLIHGETEKDYYKLSEHMRSRKEVGDILKTSTAKVTFFHAAVILGQGGARSKCWNI